MQELTIFTQGQSRNGGYIARDLDEQINRYLKEHPSHRISSINISNGVGYKEAYVVFDVSDPQANDASTRSTASEPKNKNKGENRHDRH